MFWGDPRLDSGGGLGSTNSSTLSPFPNTHSHYPPSLHLTPVLHPTPALYCTPISCCNPHLPSTAPQVYTVPQAHAATPPVPIRGREVPGTCSTFLDFLAERDVWRESMLVILHPTTSPR